MKKTPGSLVFFFLTVLTLGAAEPYFFTAKLSKESLSVGESALLTVSFHKDRSLNTVEGRYMAETYPGFENEGFMVEKEFDGDYEVEHFIRIVTAQKPGRFTLDVHGELRRFNVEDIIASNNHRDAMEAPSARTDRIQAGRLAVNVLPTDAGTLPVGEWDIRIEEGEAEVLSGEPYHFSIIIEGWGDIRKVAFPPLRIEGVELFTEPGGEERLIKEGRLWGSKRLDYAAVAQSGFVIPSIRLEYYSVKGRKPAAKASAEVPVLVRKESVGMLLDTSPERDAEESFSWPLWPLGVVVGFILGYITARRFPKRRNRAFGAWERNIKEASSQKDLLRVLLPLVNRDEFKDIIGKLDVQIVSAKELKDIKKEAIKILASSK